MTKGQNNTKEIKFQVDNATYAVLKQWSTAQNRTVPAQCRTIVSDAIALIMADND